MQEILTEAERLRQQADEWRSIAMQNQQTQQYQQPAQPQAFSYQQQAPQYPSAQLMMENPAEYDRQMQAYIAHTNQQSAQAAVQQASSFITPQLASQGKYLSQSDPRNAEIWQKWGHEIELAMVKSGLQPLQQTKEAWDTVVRFVKSDHIDELAYERAQKLAQTSGFGTESGANVSSAPSPQSDTLATFWASDSDWVRRAKESGMTLQDLRKHVSAQQVSEQQWVEDMTKGRTFRAEAA